MQKGRLIILVSLFTFFLVNLAAAQVRDSVLKPVDTLKAKTAVKPLPKDTVKKSNSAKANYVNPGKIAGRKAVLKSLILPGLGQVYNMQLLNDGYGERAGKSQAFQKIYTIAKIGAIYGGFTVLTLSYIDNSNNYKIFLAEAQYREARKTGTTNLVANPSLARYSDAGILTAKSTYKRNQQIVLFSYGLVYFANVVDAYVAARLHFFNIDDKLTFKVVPTVINNNSLYSFNTATPALKLSLTF
ncbi:DUF5683 domain-containing protein [Pedobacter punctiformis]|uniref:DUF5683 domain-containing protein n=1 Tax=Pedobacter punctiformis TaxID=3004097 RepID=A0ABT4LCW7_9SPHI|nr:DUF5683 domain-containing protein [Pedobacter sp. HCMS5-2]MCZ4245552.1 DUF5683 domain-containing protein [Pedobacter sp. HCMS5-2]